MTIQDALENNQPDSPPLPPCMVGRPFGFDEAGRALNRTKGIIIAGAVRHMLDCVGNRAVESLPADADAQAHTACIAQAQDAAFDQLIERLNAAIPDPRYHITRQYVLNEGNSYSVEFDVFISEICRTISGDPRFHFNRGAKSLPAALMALARPFPLSQVYRLLPSLTTRVADTDLRVTQVGPNSATIQWYSAKEQGMLPLALQRTFIDYSCQYIQGMLSNIPMMHSGLPVADIEEKRCQLKGDECCEWEFKWRAEPVQHRFSGLRHLFVFRAANDSAPLDQSAMLASARPASPPFDESTLPPRPAYLERAPFGAHPSGQPIREISGVALRALIDQMQAQVAQRLDRTLPANLDPAERTARVAQAQANALDQLVQRLNLAIRDHNYHVSRDYLLDTSHYYSHEFNLFANEIASDIAGDPYLFFRRGLKDIPTSLVHLVRPLSLSQVYQLVPRLATKISEGDLRAVQISSCSARIQWHPGRQLAHIPPTLHKRYIRMACQAYQGVLAAVPVAHSGLPLAAIVEHRCLLRGDDCCEWELTWPPPQSRLGLAFWIGAALSVVISAYVLLHPLEWGWLTVLVAILPFMLSWTAYLLSQSEGERDRQEHLLLEQRDRFEEQYDAWQQAHADLQLSNVALQHRLAELTTLHEIGPLLDATLNLDELLDTSLRVVTSRLGFDRAVILLVNESQSTIVRGRAIGITPEAAAIVDYEPFPLSNPNGLAARIIHADQAVLVNDLEQLSRGERAHLSELGTSAFWAVPLTAKGKPIGMLAVDNATSGRCLPENIQNLLFTVGKQIASAVDSARLYQTLEQRVEQRTSELARRAVQLQTAAEISRAASSELDLPVLLQQSVNLIAERFGLYYVGLFLVDDARQYAWLRAGTGEAGQRMLATEHKLAVDETSMIGWCIYNAHARIALDVGQEAVRFNNPYLPHTRSEMALPLTTRNQVIGALTVQSDQPQAFSRADITVLQTMADQLANAIDNAHLYATMQQELAERERAEEALGQSQRQLEVAYQREVTIARQLQTNLLPTSTPVIAGLDIAGFSQTAHYVGGDFYNYFVFDTDQVGVAMGDVSGNGLQAALMMALSFGLLANQARRESSPARLLADMNLKLRPHTLRGKLNTALCYLTLERQAEVWQVHVANAGVIAPLVRSAHGKVSWLDAGGPPLGAVPNVNYTELTYTLAPGGVLLLTSDGTVEARNPAGKMYSFDRLEACLANAPTSHATEIQDWILADVRAFTNSLEIDDDLTLVVITCE